MTRVYGLPFTLLCYFRHHYGEGQKTRVPRGPLKPGAHSWSVLEGVTGVPNKTHYYSVLTATKTQGRGASSSVFLRFSREGVGIVATFGGPWTQHPDGENASTSQRPSAGPEVRMVTPTTCHPDRALGSDLCRRTPVDRGVFLPSETPVVLTRVSSRDGGRSTHWDLFSETRDSESKKLTLTPLSGVGFSNNTLSFPSPSASRLSPRRRTPVSTGPRTRRGGAGTRHSSSSLPPTGPVRGLDTRACVDETRSVYFDHSNKTSVSFPRVRLKIDDSF